jgi:hypothetical protein
MRFIAKVLAAETDTFTGDFELDVSGKLPGIDFDYTVRGKVGIKYEWEIDSRSWGVKSFSFTAPAQKISFEVENEDDEGGESVEVTLEVPSMPLTLKTRDQDKKYIQFSPDEVVIENGKVTEITLALG